MTVDKKISYGTIKDPTFNIYKKGGPVEDKPKPNVIEFPIKPGMPLHDWYKSNTTNEQETPISDGPDVHRQRQGSLRQLIPPAK